MSHIVKVTTILGNSDQVEGRGHSIELAHFTNHADAVAVCKDERFYKKHGVMGTPMNTEYDVREKSIRVYDSVQEYWDTHDENERRQRALDKLTEADKVVLGLI